jgi:hypothetical protein
MLDDTGDIIALGRLLILAKEIDLLKHYRLYWERAARTGA